MKTLAVILAVFWSMGAAAQVRIGVPNSAYLPNSAYKAHDRINVEITNTGRSAVTFCVEFGYSSSIDAEHSEPTPTPVYVQQKDSRGWGTLLTGPDVGSLRGSETLPPGESRQFPFRVNAHGMIRIVVEYRLGSDEVFCKDRKHFRIAKSREFSIE